MNRFLSICFALIAGCLPAAAQSGKAIIQSGNVTPGHAWGVTTNGIAQDAGTAAVPFLTSIGTVGQGQTICAWTALSTAPGSQKICLGVTDAGGAQIVVQNFGTDPALPLTLILNGSTYQFPFTLPGTGVIGPNTSVVGDFAEWNNTTGTLLQDVTPTAAIDQLCATNNDFLIRLTGTWQCGATGTSGHAISFLDGNNTSSGNNIHSGTENFTGPLQVNAVQIPTPVNTTTTFYYRTDGNNGCNGLTNAAGSSGACAFADPGFCLTYIAINIDRNGQFVNCQAGETVPKTFAPALGGYICSNVWRGAGVTKLLGNHLQATVTTPVATPGVVNWTGHGLIAGSPVYFSGGTLPTGLSSTQLFYVIAAGLGANSFEVSTTVGGAAVNFTGSSSGTQTGNALTTTIDGTTNSTTGISVQASCNLWIQDLHIKASVNNVECFGDGAGNSAALYWANIITDGTPVGNDYYLNRNCEEEQIGTDWIMGQSGSAHIQGGHKAEFRNTGEITNISNGNKTYGSGGSAFVYASFGGIVTYTGSPTINLNGLTVTGTRCYAEVNGIVEQASLGATFFPGNAACVAASGGILVQ